MKNQNQNIHHTDIYTVLKKKLCMFINDNKIESKDIQCIHAFPMTDDSGSLVDGYASVFYWVNKE